MFLGCHKGGLIQTDVCRIAEISHSKHVTAIISAAKTPSKRCWQPAAPFEYALEISLRSILQAPTTEQATALPVRAIHHKQSSLTLLQQPALQQASVIMHSSHSEPPALFQTLSNMPPAKRTASVVAAANHCRSVSRSCNYSIIQHVQSSERATAAAASESCEAHGQSNFEPRVLLPVPQEPDNKQSIRQMHRGPNIQAKGSTCTHLHRQSEKPRDTHNESMLARLRYY
jgi:hypothetical protein